MISFRKINALYSKQMKNFFNNPFVAFAPIMMVGLAYLNRNILPYDAEPVQYASMLIMVVLMNIVMTGGFTMGCLIAEEKEKFTLNVLITSTVSVLDFLISNILTVATITIAANALIYFMIGIDGDVLPFVQFLLISSFGTVVGITMGASLGILSKNQAMASAMSTPLMIIIILPIFFQDNFFVDNVLYYVFTEQIAFLFLNIVRYGNLEFFRLGIIAANFVVLAGIFAYCYKKRGLE